MNIIRLKTACDADFISQVEKESEQDMSLCYQCGNCTAGCPYTTFYDIPVNQIMRLVQIGQREQVLSCKSLWLCASCESCTTRCPNDIDVARIMDVLRHMARREGYATERRVKIFWDAFLSSVERHGRVHEMGLMATYMTKTGRLFTDIELGMHLIPNGKLSLKPHPMVGKKEVSEIFKRFNEEYSS